MEKLGKGLPRFTVISESGLTAVSDILWLYIIYLSICAIAGITVFGIEGEVRF